jgi:hypothetical protein
MPCSAIVSSGLVFFAGLDSCAAFRLSNKSAIIGVTKKATTAAISTGANSSRLNPWGALGMMVSAEANTPARQ